MPFKDSGFLLIQVVVATALITLAAAALGRCFVMALQSEKISENSLIATLLAEQKLEQMKSLALSAADEADERLTLNNQIFVRRSKITLHPAYATLFIVTVTVFFPASPSQQQAVSYSTYVVNQAGALHP